ncbi:MAG: Holliday junction branch migration protein RuvA [Gammaproteobacteria bacterium]|nr:Holliday junction branch migration protein RuvA [Gammaproteobacteria bacterium]MDH5650903.1 Holliday junction branch migration protein RuvA [Gammaproteobacteria bacterium]
MIGRLTGQLITKQPPMLLLDVNGVGYEIEAPMSTFYQLPATGKQVTLHTHLVVREDAWLLCGFASEAERRMFRDLIKVNGVGAKLALTILSGISAEDFAHCIQEGDSATLVRLPGVGKKTAERLIIEMRDRLKSWSDDGMTLLSSLPVNGEAMPASREAISALVALGYKPHEAGRMVSAVKQEGASSEELIRAALKTAVN